MTIEITATTATGTVMIDPANPYTFDRLRGYIAGLAESFDLIWYKNGAEYKTDYGTESFIEASETTKHDIWILKAFTPLYSAYIGEALVRILNSAPAISSITAPATAAEGNAISVLFTATDADDDAISYRIYRNGILITSTNSNSWTTASGDAGSYTYKFVVTDGEEQDTETRTITITPSGITSLPVCGNSVVETGETCDDGNLVSGDGCSATCIIESTPPNPPTPFVNKVLTLGKDLEISSLYNYIKIRNRGNAKLDDLNVKITFVDISSFEQFNVDLGRNDVILRVLNTEIKDNSTYLANVEISVDDLKDSGYMLIEN